MIYSLFRKGMIYIGTVLTAGSCRIEVNRWWQDCQSYEQYYLYSQTYRLKSIVRGPFCCQKAKLTILSDLPEESSFSCKRNLKV